MYTQEIKCPKCGKMTRVNVCDAEGETVTPCGQLLSKSFFAGDTYCDAKIIVKTDSTGRVVEIRKQGFWG